MKPIPIFVSGLAVPSAVVKLSWGIWWLFKRQGYDLKVAMMPEALSIEERSTVLLKEIKRLNPKGLPYHLIGHSLGGLDARFVVQFLEHKPLSVTTISTPHRGSILADGHDFGDKPNAFQRAVMDLTTAYCKGFNTQVKDDLKVKYFSIACYLPQPVVLTYPLGLLEWAKIYKQDGANDSMVSVNSAKWGIVLDVIQCPHLLQVNPISWRGRAVWKTIYQTVINNLNKI